MNTRNGASWTGLARAAAGLALLAASTAPLAQASHDVKISGSGTTRCADWNAWKAEGNAERRGTAVQWVFGFVAGHNVYALRGHRSQQSLTPQAGTLETLIDRHCEAHPTARLVEAAVATVSGLGGASTQIKPPGARTLPAAPPVRQQAL